MTRKLLVALSVALMSARMAESVPAPAIDELEVLADRHDLNGIQAFAFEHDEILSQDNQLLAAVLAISRDATYSFSDMSYDVAARHGRWKSRGYRPWADRPGKGRKAPPPKHPHIY